MRRRKRRKGKRVGRKEEITDGGRFGKVEEWKEKKRKRRKTGESRKKIKEDDGKRR